MFNSWGRELPNAVEACAVRPPRRESRVRGLRLELMPDFFEKLVDGLDSAVSDTCAIFGHSVGAVRGLEFTRDFGCGEELACTASFLRTSDAAA
jgi:medium-chain acyl-[acyl-carrier-protein] hydrolase